MPKQKISEFNSNPALNTDIDSINIAEGCAPSGINDAIRELMSQLKDWQSGTSNDPMVIGSTGSLTLNQGTANGVAYLNGSKVVTSGSALTFDGTTLTNANTIKVQTASGTAPKFWIGQAATSAWSIGSPASADALVFVDEQFSSEKMRLTSTGLVVGGTAATNTSSGRGNITINGSSSAILSMGTGGTAKGYVYHSGSDMIVNATTGTLALQANGNGALIDSSGNLGLGVTPSAWSTSKAIQVGSTAALFSYNNATTDVGSNVYYDGASYKYITTNSASFARQTSGGHSWYTAASGTAGNAITFTQAMTLTASSELLVNRTSASGLGKLNVEGGADFTNGNVLIGRDSGNLLVGTTATVNAAKSVFSFSSSSNGVYLIDSTGVSGAQFMRFDSTSNTCGSITRVAATSAVTYNTTSDYRLKEVICAVSDSGSRIDALHPIEYTWKSDGTRTRGFLAHQFQEVYANSVTGTKDAVDADGNPEYQSMQAGSAEVIADLVAEIQSLRKRLADAGL